MLMCLLEGMAITSEMPGYCSTSCDLFLHTCLPKVSLGLLTGCECCGDSYCNDCPVYDACEQQKGESLCYYNN